MAGLLVGLVGCAANGSGAVRPRDGGPDGGATDATTSSDAADAGTTPDAAPPPDGGPADSGYPPDGPAERDAAPRDDGGSGGDAAAPACDSHAECDDGIACTTDRCIEGECVHAGTDWDGDGYAALGCADGEDCDDHASDVHPGATERCDGADNDCDGEADGQFLCAAGETTSCTTGTAVEGVQTCRDDCSGFGACVAEEACNGEDDNDDGTCDEGFACCAGEAEPCSARGCTGTRSCSNDCELGVCDLGAAPANDTCSGTIPTITGAGNFDFRTCTAGSEYGAACGNGAGAPDVVYRLEVSEPSNVVLEVTQATFDTVLHLRSGTGCPGSELACDDDGGEGRLSRIDRMLEPGTYWVVVDGFGDTAAGSGTLAASVAPSTPVHDDCPEALDLALGQGRTIITGSTAGSTDADSTCGTGPDLWFRFTLPRREMVFIHTYGSGYDTAIGLRESSCGASTTACDNDSCGGQQSQIVQNLPAGTYYLVVDGSSGAMGDFRVTLEHLPLGSSGLAAEPGPGTTYWTGTTTGTGVLDDCRAGTAPEQAWVWTHCPDHPGGAFEATTCDPHTEFDTVLYLWSGEHGASLACNDDTLCGDWPRASRVSTALPAGAGLFMLYVDGFSGRSGYMEAMLTRP